ncbi:MAG TPA: hypothetical protein VHC47_03350, partial [Mucilaginibacter sp.]|nr:hypothetical protein [Mucilaginibacter sp.]
IFFLFILFNYGSVIDLYYLFAKGSNKEQEGKRDTDIDFYYRMFKACSDIEFNQFLKMYKDYPIEAQTALDRIKSEKNIN